MTRPLFLSFLSLLCLLLFHPAAEAAEPAAAPPDRRLFTGKDTGGTVYLVPQFTEFKEVSKNDLLFLRSVIKRAEKEKARAIIFELDTPGGDVDVALRYISVFAKSEVPVVAYLNPQGISAGMIIALAADRIAIHEMGVIGDAMPIQAGLDGLRPVVAPEEKPDGDGEEKTAEKKKEADRPARGETVNPLIEELRELIDSRKDRPAGPADESARRLLDQKFLTVFYKVLQVLAEKNGRPVRVIRATADPNIRLTREADGIDHFERSPLTLSAREAEALNVVDYVVRGRNDILAGIGLPDATVEVIKPGALDQVFHFLAYPAVALLLIAVGLTGIFVEIKTPGFGVPGTLGISAIVLYFLGQMGIGGFDWGPIVVFFVGVILIALEIFVIPGFGVIGVLGAVCLLGALVAAMGIENFETAIQVVGGGLLVALLVITLLVMYVLPKSALFKRVSLGEAIGRDPGSEAAAAECQLGRSGVALTALRPAGVIGIDGKRFEATTEGGFIEAGTTVEVVGARNFQLIAKAVEAPPETEKKTEEIG